MKAFPKVEKCGKCGRKILIEYAFSGSPHLIGQIITCADCVFKDPRVMEKGKEVYGVEKWNELLRELR